MIKAEIGKRIRNIATVKDTVRKNLRRSAELTELISQASKPESATFL